MATVTSANWADGGAYERYMGRWSSLVAESFVRWLDLSPDLNWLDVGAGTGALSLSLARTGRASAVTAVEPTAGFRAEGQRLRGDPAVSYVDGDVEHLPPGPFDAAVSGLVLNFVPDATAAVHHMRESTTDGGTVAGYVWDYASGMEFIRVFWEVAATVDASAVALNQGARSDICNPEALEALWARSGLHGIRSRGLVVDVVFADFEDYWHPFTGGQGAAPTYVAGLDQDQTERLRTALRDRLSGAPGAPIAMTARAWAVAGTR